ncbi:hypothetical protein [Luteirhabdus pelagi]|uniref:hypothetical protein n=1 Tax=Luteirhabdus pelagi TaxID=2792783 RepID=UPI00193A17A2|nr:hypothetical protein [Luteirhabdus pelagi]
MIGDPIVVDLKKLKPIGGPGLFLKSFENKVNNSESIEIDSKCNIEKRPDGILIHASKSNRQTLIPIPTDNVLEIEIIRGKEQIDPFFLSPMWILLKMGVSVLYARYFRLRMHEYHIDQMELKLTTTDYEFDFNANGYLFERQLKFLKNLNYDKKLKIERKAST